MGRGEEQGRRFLLAAVVVIVARLSQRSELYILVGPEIRKAVYKADELFADLVESAYLEQKDLSLEHFFSSEALTPDACLEISGKGGLSSRQKRVVGPAVHFHEQGESGKPEWVAELSGTESWGAAPQRVLRYLETLMEAVVRDPHQPAGTLPLLDTGAALDLYSALNDTRRRYPQEPVDSLIRQQSMVDPEAVAVVFEERSATYRTLEERSGAMAAVLRGRGADQQRPVAIAVSRSENLPILLLAVLRAGSFFVPLDPTHPRQRLLDILEECQPAVVVVSTTTRAVFDGTSIALFSIEDLMVEAAAAGSDRGAASTPRSQADKAYTIYTSGTTGRPKGVMVPHRALTNFVSATQHEPGMRRGDRMLGVATISFDIALMDMFLPLASGATLVVAAEDDTKEPVRLAQLLERERITCMQATPATWRMLMASGWAGKPGLKMLSGGETLPRDLADALIRRDGDEYGELWNSYGPTETTIYSSFFRVEDGSGAVPIGPPTANTKFYIADPAGNLLPPDVAGELYIGGDGVALGYFERDQLTAAKFIDDPWSVETTQKLFRTGDAARVREDGALDFFGRLDSQVKLRGYRIELGEIESILRSHASVRDAAVVLREDAPGEPWLVAYVVCADPAVSCDLRGLRAYAAQRLPAYMLPSRIAMVAELPLTGSGKVDRRALREMPSPPEEGLERGSESPASPTEAALLKVFREVLRSTTFGVTDNFFDYGGYSLLAVRLFARIANVLGTELPITALFEAPTVRELAVLAQQGQQGRNLKTIVSIREGGDQAPFFMVQSYLLYGMAASLVPGRHPVRGVREEASHTREGMAFDERVRLYADAIERSSPEGVLHLGGWCAAAIFTVEIARRLQAQGREIGMLALFDAEAPGFVAAPARGSAWFARVRAAWAFHGQRLRGATWRDRLRYIVKRVPQQPLRWMEWFYMRHRKTVLRLKKTMPFLPNVVFYNRWTQIAPVDQPAPAPLDGKIVLFRALDVIDVPNSDEALGWRRIALRGVEVVFVPGDHESMFHEPHLSVLRREFARALRAAEEELRAPVLNDGMG